MGHGPERKPEESAYTAVVAAFVFEFCSPLKPPQLPPMCGHQQRGRAYEPPHERGNPLTHAGFTAAGYATPSIVIGASTR